MAAGVEVKRVDSQGRLILPSDWREELLKEANEVYIVKRKDYLKVIPKRRVDLRKFFDKDDLAVYAIGDWKDFEKLHAEKVRA